MEPASRLDQLEGVAGALAGQIIVLLAQNRALQQLVVDKGVATADEVRAMTLGILERELDQMTDEVLPAELGSSVKSTLREALAAARNA